jgi:uncharacterized protein with NRDE domain
MCLLAILWRVVEDAPLLVAANREEAYARPGTPPQVVDGPVRFLAGLDPLAGGTWFGLNAHGVLVAVTNGLKHQVPPQPRSRGLLVRDLLQSRSAQEATQRAVKELQAQPYAGCNLLCADVKGVNVIQAGDWLQVSPLPPGGHVLVNNGRLNDASLPRLAYAQAWLSAQHYRTGEEWLAAFPQLCGQREKKEIPAICVRGKDRGTLASSLLLLRPSLRQSRYLHAQGPPDTTPYEDYSTLLPQL